MRPDKYYEDKLPDSVQEIADVIGRDKALEFIGKLPASGNRAWRVCVYIPKVLPLDHKLVELLGYPDALKMVRAFSGMILQPSNCRFYTRLHRNRQIIRLKKEGMSSGEIADIFEISPYRVREIIALETASGRGQKCRQD